MRRAVIDVGSGSVVLVVGEMGPSGWTVLATESESTFLGEGVKQTGVLGEAGMTRTLATIRNQFDIAESFGAETVAAGTMALRIATNQAEFLARADAQGTPVCVLSAKHEAELGFLAVANDPMFVHHERIAIIDPGGQSTELVVAERTGAGWEYEHRHSYPVGTLQLRGGRLAAETPDISDLFMASVDLDTTIGIVPRIGEGATIALGSPGTDLIMLRDRLPSWQPQLIHGAYLDYEEIGKAVGWLMRMDDAGRKSAGPLEAGRERTIHAGTLILERFLNAIAAPGCYVSIRGWRNALLENPDFSLE